MRKYGDLSRLSVMCEEVGGTVKGAMEEERLELMQALLSGCREAVSVAADMPAEGAKPSLVEKAKKVRGWRGEKGVHLLSPCQLPRPSLSLSPFPPFLQ